MLRNIQIPEGQGRLSSTARRHPDQALLLAVGNGLFVLALQQVSLALVAVLVALYPLATILLARIVLRENVSTVQWLGIGLAVFAAGLMGLSGGR